MSFKRLRERLDEYGFRPSRKLGQNFLIDPKLLGAIADALPIESDALVLEVGAGTGHLTRELARRGARIVAVEVDSRLVEFLRDEIASWGELGERVTLVAGDALEKGRLAPRVLDALAAKGARAGGFSCISNLPYSVAGPFLASLWTSALPCGDGVVLTQYEMGERLVAAPGTSEYGTLSVLAAIAHEVEILRRVPGEVFRPRPRVDSALLRLGPVRSGWLARPHEEREAFGRFLQALFGGRRKVLRNALARAFPDRDVDAWAATAPIDPEWLRMRPGALSPAQLDAVFVAGT